MTGGADEEITPPGDGLIENRKAVYTAARKRHPERWSGDIRDWSLEDVVWLNPERTDAIAKAEKLKAA